MMLSKAVPKDAQTVEVGGRVVVDHFMYQLQKLYHHLHHGKKKYVVPKDFCFSFKNFEGQPINTSIQEDAHEFLNRLIESAEEAFKKEGRVGEFEELLSIRKLSEIECEVCKHRIDKIENDYCLTLEVKNHDSLAESLRKFTEREEITGYFC
jgi:ubiquitin carboxyl-terminal hydrolase 9/24